MDSLRVTSCLAANADPSISAIAGYLAGCLGQPVTFDAGLPWQERERGLDSGEIQAGWLCGWPYVRKVDGAGPRLTLLAAQVMAAPRYNGRPIYFSDVIVKRDSRFASFADLRDAVWAYNDPGSQSGYNIVAYHLAGLGETWDYFRRVVQTGSHAVSIARVLSGAADGAAIDSTLLDTELHNNPLLGEQLRSIAALGPSPMPPWVASASLRPEENERLRQALLGMHRDPAGRAVLAEARIARFVAVADSDYDAIREMAKVAEGVKPLATNGDEF